MKKFIRKHNLLYRTAAKITDDISRIEFSNLWQKKKYTEALAGFFPTSWEWIGSDLENQLVSDYPVNLGTGEVVSEKLFNLLRKKYPDETNLNHELLIDGHKYFWFSPPVIEKEELDSTALNIFMVRPRYTTMYSEDFVNLWKDNGFTGHEFVEVN